jgi:hypothetical protein
MNYTKKLVISRSKATRNPYKDLLQCITIEIPHLPDLSAQGQASSVVNVSEFESDRTRQARWGFGMTH